MAPIPWTAPAISDVHNQPPTLAGLVAALAAADDAARLLAEGGPGTALHRALAVRDACRAARACLEAATHHRRGAATPVLDPPAESDDPGHLRELEPVLAACIELAVDLLDNEDEPLRVSHVTAIGQAVGHLDTARWKCWEAEQ
jgi:hypothetical protein